VVVLFIYSFESLQAPTWDVSVVNASNDPVSGARVRESYRDYSAEFEGGEADLITDFQGKGTFPAKTVRANILKRIAAILRQLQPVRMRASDLTPTYLHLEAWTVIR
jgi:hypothetical protein